MSRPPARPLTLGEIFAETIHLYGERVWSALALGALYSVILAAAILVHEALYYVIASLMLVVAYGVATRLVGGDSFREAWAQVAVRLPVLLVLALVVGLPFVLASTYLLLLVFGAFWLGLTGFAVPVAVSEREEERGGWAAAVAYALERTIALARAEYLHAVGVTAALLLVNVLVGVLLGAALVGYADNSSLVGSLLAQLVLAPFFFLGLSVLYFEQTTRAAPAGRSSRDGSRA
ncbi:MAG TPA: hypothetical protein VHF23_03375 [Gaiellaceae bacterium]|nr:hypothetical protein [Gaiellaceae bacterium]